jgi:NADPH:quinone reductase-like Zn-dependent oxidoreductase
VLVKVAAAPCNPSDLLLLQGKYGALKTLPTVPGWEGAGTVVASGGGWLAGWLRGKRVAFGLQGDRDGSWAEYAVANATECIPLKRQLGIEQAASLIVNPLTAMGLLDTARRRGHPAAVHTAGASQLGRMLIVMAAEVNYPLINIVRRDAQVDLLRSLGAAHVLNSSDEDFVEQLQATCARLGATCAFEAVAGDMTGTVLNNMPPGSTVYVYGALSEDACSNIDPIGLIFRDKSVRGFYLSDWLRRRGSLGILRAAGRVQRMLIDGRIQTRLQRKIALDNAREGLKQYVDHMTDGKVLIMPHER